MKPKRIKYYNFVHIAPYVKVNQRINQIGSSRGKQISTDRYHIHITELVRESMELQMDICIWKYVYEKCRTWSRKRNSHKIRCYALNY